MKTNTRKLLVPLATLLAAGAIAVGSGATFTSTSGNTISAVTAGTLTQSNSKANAAIFTLSNMKPGDVVNGSVTLTNTGSLPATFSLSEDSSVNNFAGSDLTETITDTTTNTVVYSGVFGGLVDGQKQALGTWPAGQAHTFTFSVALDINATNVDQAKTANAVYSWSSVQVNNGDTTNQ
jgi:hypothetical protein